MQLFELKYIIVASIYKKVKGRGLVLVGAPQSFWQNFDLACSAPLLSSRGLRLNEWTTLLGLFPVALTGHLDKIVELSCNIYQTFVTLISTEVT